MLTVDTLRRIYTAAPRARLAKHLDGLNAAMVEYNINTPNRQAAFLGQCGHESSELYYTEEIASGNAYEGRKDLGNTQPGDGRRFKGHGFIQNTGRANHEAYAEYKGMTLDAALAFMQTSAGASDVSGWWWMRNTVNPVADEQDWRGVSGMVNAGNRHAKRINHLPERLAYTARALKVLTS